MLTLCFIFVEVAVESTADVSSDKVKPEQQQQQPEEPAPVITEKVAETVVVEEQSPPPEPEIAEVPVVVQEQNNAVEQVVEEKVVVVETPVQVGAVKSTARNIKSPIAATTKTATKPVGASGAVGRSQIPKASATTKATESSPTKVTAEVTRTSPTKTATTSAVKSRSSMAVVGRAKTVELGKTVTKKMSVGELQAPRVVRQMSTGHMQPQSPSRSLPLKSNPRLKSNESPVKKIVATSVKTEESKKTATTTGNLLDCYLYIFGILC